MRHHLLWKSYEKNRDKESCEEEKGPKEEIA